MSQIDREVLDRLGGVEERPAISIYISRKDLSRAPSRALGRFDDIFHRVEEQAKAAGYDREKVAALLAPAGRLVTDNFAWSPSAKSLSVFVSPSVLVIHPLPAAIKQNVFVSDKFHLKPIVDLQRKERADGPPAAHMGRAGFEKSGDRGQSRGILSRKAR